MRYGRRSSARRRPRAFARRRPGSTARPACWNAESPAGISSSPDRIPPACACSRHSVRADRDRRPPDRRRAACRGRRSTTRRRELRRRSRWRCATGARGRPRPCPRTIAPRCARRRPVDQLRGDADAVALTGHPVTGLRKRLGARYGHADLTFHNCAISLVTGRRSAHHGGSRRSVGRRLTAHVAVRSRKVCRPAYLNRANCCQMVRAASVPKNSVDHTSVATRHAAGLIASGSAPRLRTISRNE